MKNVDMRVDGEKLVITIDLKARHGQSKSGKTTIIASTIGNVPVPGHEHATIGLNVYTKA